MKEHEKRIREALCLADQDEELITVVASRDIRALLADLDEARAALTAAKAGGWLPIETAPKDGRRVLVWIDDKHLASQKRQVNFAKLWFYEDGRLGGGAEGLNGEWNITHWQPLPNPPKEQA